MTKKIHCEQKANDACRRMKHKTKKDQQA